MGHTNDFRIYSWAVICLFMLGCDLSQVVTWNPSQEQFSLLNPCRTLGSLSWQVKFHNFIKNEREEIPFPSPGLPTW